MWNPKDLGGLQVMYLRYVFDIDRTFTQIKVRKVKNSET